MEATLKTFNTQKESTLNILNQLHNFLLQGEGLGINIDSSLVNKLDTAIKSLSDDNLKIALIGGFSEGKTSIAAAWMERLDQSTMNISQQESSDAVSVYSVSNGLQLIDTPGLFGFKEKINADSSAIEKYKDITKKYVSEAHLVLYVMNSTNPIKDSHQEDLKWLFRTLNILPRTVFVLSRFDEVADVEDINEYNENLHVKKGNVVNRLKDLINLEQDEADGLSIVAVAANPFDMGTEYWLDNLEKFKQLSHIESLQAATNEKVASNGGVESIVVEAKNSIVRDVLNEELPLAIENDKKLGQEVEKMLDVVDTMKAKLTKTQGLISDSRVGLRDFVTSYFADLILQVQGTDLETFNDFFQREVGDDGVVISSRLQSEFDRYLRSANLEVKSMASSFTQEVNHFNDAVLGYGKQGVGLLVKSNVINNTSVIAARDGIKSLAGFVGMDLSNLLKFKPWGAVKAANAMNGVLAAAGIAFEAWDSYKQREREKKFQAGVEEMVMNFNNQRKELLELVNGDEFVSKFFQSFIELEKGVAELENNLAGRTEQRDNFHKWRMTGEKIKQEFETL
ncbi:MULTISPECIES: LeoA/HP0731 family dynamin-like GTPase [unclassified Pseudoalteromonas]|uniref:LeoA/HP0731 family dynamin-like GTPase n=1 Tax=unclassified Pseudoalteromonas TaxID=194690 RepID=UPI0015FED63D|nr:MULTISPECIES: LeoA/HP0731 family dynamin-like GTPase [unclassified Pseudoalteromonas]MBB1351516.1 50S ribosome-binding GTPase [Pseudoalteromonas sp. SG45-3]MBB1358316.1 50S ribosome-binding GTPase [Pseudoalteromonas sp. SG45-6]